jgi:hypothetical protein
MTGDTDLQALVTILQNAIEWYEASEKGVTISPAAAEGILAILRALPHSTPKGRPKPWTYFDEQHALKALLADAKVNELAREMARRTGQSEPSARRRLREMKASDRLKELRKAATRKKAAAKKKKGVQK